MFIEIRCLPPAVTYRGPVGDSGTPSCIAAFEIYRLSPAAVPDTVDHHHNMTKSTDEGAVVVLLEPCDFLCAPHKFCSKQNGNILLNNLVLDAQPSYKAIDHYNRKEKNGLCWRIITDLEATGGRFIVREVNSYALASDRVKKETIRRRLLCKLNGSKRL